MGGASTMYRHSTLRQFLSCILSRLWNASILHGDARDCGDGHERDEASDNPCWTPRSSGYRGTVQGVGCVS